MNTPDNFKKLDDWEYSPGRHGFVNKWHPELFIEDTFLIKAPKVIPWLLPKTSAEVNDWLNAVVKIMEE